MNRWDELICIDCNCHVGWISDAGPRGMAYCDSCKESEDRRELEDES